jgi:hypothetical protein
MATAFIPADIPPPDQGSYQYKPGKSFIEVELDGGSPRLRRDKIGMCHYLTCKFSCTPPQYTRLMAFFRERLEDHTQQFRIPLKIDVAEVVSYRCQITGEPPFLAENQGLLHVVQASLKVFPNPILAASVQLKNAGTPQFVATGSTDASLFPVGRSVQIVSSAQTVTGVPIALDGFYTISGAPSATIREITVPAPMTAAWAALLGTVPQAYTLTNGGAVILMPE